MLSPILVANIFDPNRGLPGTVRIFLSQYKEICTPTGGERATLGYVCKNGPVQEDINPSI